MRKRFLVAVAVIAASVVLSEPSWAGAEWMPEPFRVFRDWLLELIKRNPEWAAFIVGLLAFGESLPFVSMILPFWGILVAIGVLLPTLGLDFNTIMLAAAVGAAAGDWLGFWLGYRFRGWAERKGLLNPDKDACSGWVARWVLPRIEWLASTWWGGIILITVARFSGPLRASVPIMAGALRMNRLVFQIANWPSALLWAWVLLRFGDAFYEYLLRPFF